MISTGRSAQTVFSLRRYSMSRRSSLARALPLVAAVALTLTACGEQTPGGVQESGGEQASAQAEQADANNPIVVKIGEDEFATNMAIFRKYEEAKGGPLALQAPVAPAEDLDGGKRQNYASGTVFWSPETGAHIVRGQILTTYYDNGGPGGTLGWPVSDEAVDGEAVFTDFQRGQIRLENQAIRVIEQAG